MNDVLPVNFSISAEALAEANNIKAIYNTTADDPFDILSVGWGLYNMNDGRKFENVIVSFYDQSKRSQIEHVIQSVSGVPVVFFVTNEHYDRFSGKIVDFKPDRGFYLL